MCADKNLAAPAIDCAALAAIIRRSAEACRFRGDAVNQLYFPDSIVTFPPHGAKEEKRTVVLNCRAGEIVEWGGDVAAEKQKGLQAMPATLFTDY